MVMPGTIKIETSFPLKESQRLSRVCAGRSQETAQPRVDSRLSETSGC